MTVVIPTTLRPTVARAIASVRAQRFAGSVTVVAVVDRHPRDCSARELAAVSNADETVFTGDVCGAGSARNLGVAVATADLVAFLDDDDAWLPAKLAAQVPLLDAASRDGRRVVVSSRVTQVVAGSGAGQVSPRRLIGASEAVEDYLFHSRAARSDRPSMPTSSLLMTASTARLVPWRSLPRHQDWDWLVRAQKVHGVHLVHHPAVAVRYSVGSRDSISAQSNWRDSLAWARSWQSQWAPATYVDFVCAQPLRYALQQRSVTGVLHCLVQVVRLRRLPAPGPLGFALSGLLPRSAVERLVFGARPHSRALALRPFVIGRPRTVVEQARAGVPGGGRHSWTSE